MAFSAVGVERNCCTVSKLCCRVWDAAISSFCRASGLTTWLCAIRSMGTKKTTDKMQAIAARTNGRMFNCIVGVPPIDVPAREEVYTKPGSRRCQPSPMAIGAAPAGRAGNRTGRNAKTGLKKDRVRRKKSPRPKQAAEDANWATIFQAGVLAAQGEAAGNAGASVEEAPFLLGADRSG